MSQSKNVTRTYSKAFISDTRVINSLNMLYNLDLKYPQCSTSWLLKKRVVSPRAVFTLETDVNTKYKFCVVWTEKWQAFKLKCLVFYFEQRGELSTGSCNILIASCGGGAKVERPEKCGHLYTQWLNNFCKIFRKRTEQRHTVRQKHGSDSAHIAAFKATLCTFTAAALQLTALALFTNEST